MYFKLPGSGSLRASRVPVALGALQSSSSWGRDALNCSKEIHCAWRSPGHLTRNSCLLLPLNVVVLVSRTSAASWDRAACPPVVALLGNVLGNVADSLNILRNPTLIVLWHLHSGGYSSVYASPLTRARTANGPTERAAHFFVWSPSCAPGRACVSTRTKLPGSNVTADRLLS